MNENSTLRAVILAVAIVFARALVSRGIVQFRLADRYVSVKGVAADVGIWPLRFVSTDDVLDRAREKIESDRRRVIASAGPRKGCSRSCRAMRLPGSRKAPRSRRRCAWSPRGSNYRRIERGSRGLASRPDRLPALRAPASKVLSGPSTVAAHSSTT